MTAEPAQHLEPPWWESEKPPSATVFEPDYQVPMITELLSMPAKIRGRHLEQVILHDHHKGTRVYDDYVRERDRCTFHDQDGRRCTKIKWDNLPSCLAHATIEELDPTSAREHRTRQAKLRMVELLEASVDQLSKMITAPPEEITPGVRLNAITALFDRVGLPKEQSSTVQAHIVTEDYSRAGDVVRERLKMLSENFVDDQIRALEAGQVIEGEAEAENDNSDQ